MKKRISDRARFDLLNDIIEYGSARKKPNRDLRRRNFPRSLWPIFPMSILSVPMRPMSILSMSILFLSIFGTRRSTDLIARPARSPWRLASYLAMMIGTVCLGRWTLDVGRWTFSSSPPAWSSFLFFAGVMLIPLRLSGFFHPGGQRPKGSVMKKVRMPNEGMIISLEPQPFEVTVPLAEGAVMVEPGELNPASPPRLVLMPLSPLVRLAQR